MHTVLLTQIQLFQTLAHPHGVRGHFEVGNVDITIQQTVSIERTLLTIYLSGDVA